MRENRHRNIEHISSMRSRLGGIEWAMVGKEGYISRDRDEDDEVNKYLCTTTFALCARHRRPSHLAAALLMRTRNRCNRNSWCCPGRYRAERSVRPLVCHDMKRNRGVV